MRGGSAKSDLQMRLLHAAFHHGHSFNGCERLASELVPRCRPLKEQLQQTVTSICVAQQSSAGLYKTASERQAAVEYEVERFLRARLVVIDLCDFLTHDVFDGRNEDEESEDSEDEEQSMRTFAVAQLGAKNKRSWKESMFGDSAGRRGPPPISQLDSPFTKMTQGQLSHNIQVMGLNSLAKVSMAGGNLGAVAGGVAEAARKAEKHERHQRHLERALKKFELLFFRALSKGLGRCLFGAREDLCLRFEVAAMNVLHSFQGELHLALHALMGWLPSGVSESLFITLVGLPALTSVRQQQEKFSMLLSCINALVHGSGRYVFVCTPSWYLPLSTRLGGLGRMHDLREKSADISGGRAITSLRSIWPNPCLEPHEVIAAVNSIWGEAIPGVRAQFGLCRGVEAMGTWVLRMTLGCEGLLALVVQALRDFAPTCEGAYDDLVREGRLQIGTLVPDDPALARCFAEVASRVIVQRAAKIRSTESIKRYAEKRRIIDVRKCLTEKPLGSEPRHVPFRGMKSEGQIVKEKYEAKNFLTDVDSEDTAGGTRRPGEKANLLAQLQRGDQTTVKSKRDGDGDAQRLRRVVEIGRRQWPLGQPGRLGGRISIYDSPELLPDAEPPPLEDKFMLPEGAEHAAGGAECGAKSTLTRARTAPHLRHPKSFAEELAEMAVLNKRSASTNRRASSAPPRVDPSDFDVGDILKNTAVALSLQAELTRVLSAASSEGPLSLCWRQGRSDTETAELLRLRLSVGALLLFAALRAALPANAEISLKHFVTTKTIGANETEIPQPPKAEPLAEQKVDDKKEKAQPREGGGKEKTQAAKSKVAKSSKEKDKEKESVAEKHDDDKLEEVKAREPTAMPSRRPLFKTALADGITSMGFVPIFHNMASAQSARTSPVVASDFHIALPHVLLESRVLQDVLVERTGGGARWSTGSLLVLLAAYGLEEEQISSLRWSRLNGWVRQQHASFFSMACCFRVILGFELLNLYFVARPTDREPQLMDAFPFLKHVRSSVKSISSRLDMSSLAGRRPLLLAPQVSPRLPGTKNFNPNFAQWGKEFTTGGIEATGGVPLMDFAAWVGNLRPGRIIYSSLQGCRSADLIFRLKGCVLILAFKHNGNEPLPICEIFRMYRESVGEASWWGKNVKKIFYIVFSNHLEKAPEDDLQVAMTGQEGPAKATPTKFISCLEFREGDRMINRPVSFDIEKQDAPIRKTTNRKNARAIAQRFFNAMDKSKLARDTNESDPQEVAEFDDDGEVESDWGEDDIVCVRDQDCTDGIVRPCTEAVFEHREVFENEITKEESGFLQKEEDMLQADINRAKWMGSVPVKPNRNQPVATKRQMDLNLEALRGILQHIHEHTSRVQQLIEEVISESEDNSVLGSAVSSMRTSPEPHTLPKLPQVQPQEPFEQAGYPEMFPEEEQEEVFDAKQKLRDGVQAVMKDVALINDRLNEVEMSKETSSSDEDLGLEKAVAYRTDLHWAELYQAADLMLLGLDGRQKRRGALKHDNSRSDENEKEDLHHYEALTGEDIIHGHGPTHVTFQLPIQKNQDPPQHRRWRPPTPHPAQSNEAARRILNTYLHQKSGVRKTRRGLKFDWIGWNLEADVL
eukprot:TRINITY_DN28000_c0_g1_i2.p1 TRINITY_DN28000_c0_g1~~TRINITY_DN28000_c0_g1_i2.p1  ORF type:complete len:1730 (+),score=352.19 TRINITY_DN28000_c0_g1_i2:396-5192(+)